jgi:hypothetical protein
MVLAIKVDVAVSLVEVDFVEELKGSVLSVAVVFLGMNVVWDIPVV